MIVLTILLPNYNHKDNQLFLFFVLRWFFHSGLYLKMPIIRNILMN